MKLLLLLLDRTEQQAKPRVTITAVSPFNNDHSHTMMSAIARNVSCWRCDRVF